MVKLKSFKKLFSKKSKGGDDKDLPLALVPSPILTSPPIPIPPPTLPPIALSRPLDIGLGEFDAPVASTTATAPSTSTLRFPRSLSLPLSSLSLTRKRTRTRSDAGKGSEKSIEVVDVKKTKAKGKGRKMAKFGKGIKRVFGIKKNGAKMEEVHDVHVVAVVNDVEYLADVAEEDVEEVMDVEMEMKFVDGEVEVEDDVVPPVFEGVEEDKEIDDDYSIVPSSFDDDYSFVETAAEIEAEQGEETQLAVCGASSAVIKYAGVGSELDDINLIVREYFEAFHHNSVLDARRNPRIGLPTGMVPYRNLRKIVLDPRWQEDKVVKGMVAEMYRAWKAHIGLDPRGAKPICSNDGESEDVDNVEDAEDEDENEEIISPACAAAFVEDDDSDDSDAHFGHRRDDPIDCYDSDEVVEDEEPQVEDTRTFEIFLRDFSPDLEQAVESIKEDLCKHNPDHVFEEPKLALRVVKYLGGGCSGGVYSVKDVATGQLFAVKVAPKVLNDGQIANLLNERFIAELIAESPWFTKLHAAWHDTQNFYFMMSICPSDLDSLILDRGLLHPALALFYICQILLGLNSLHSMGIVHRDIKPANILIQWNGHAVIGDFGLAVDFGKEPDSYALGYQPQFDDRMEVMMRRKPKECSRDQFLVNEYSGSEGFFAPEVILRIPHSFMIDYWSSAVTLVWMITGGPAWTEKKSDKPGTLQWKILSEPVIFDEELEITEEERSFIEGMLQKIPTERMEREFEVFNHPYFDDIDWDAMKQQQIPPPFLPETHLETGQAEEERIEVGDPIPIEEDEYPTFTYVSSERERLLLHGLKADYEDSIAPESSTASVEDSGVISTPYPDEGAFDEGRIEVEPSEVDDLEPILEAPAPSAPLTSCLVVNWDRSQINRASTQPFGPGRSGGIFDGAPTSSSEDSVDTVSGSGDEALASVGPSSRAPSVEIEELESDYEFVEIPLDMPDVEVVVQGRRGWLRKMKKFFTKRRTSVRKDVVA